MGWDLCRVAGVMFYDAFDGRYLNASVLAASLPANQSSYELG